MAAAEEFTEPLKYQTLVLKVPIHCEGCKKKVKKVLQTIDAVYKTTIDSQLHKVTVTGNVEADVLIKKLNRYGKRAELWPEPKPTTTPAGNSSGGKKSKNKKNKSANSQQTETPEKNPSASNEDIATDVTCDSPTAVEAEAENIKDVTKPSDATKPNEAATPPPAEKVAGGGAGGTPAGSTPAGSGKKKKKKGNKEGNGTAGEAATEEGGKAVAPAPAQAQASSPAAGGQPLLPRQPAFNYPAYVLSYSAAQPCYGAAGYFPVQPSSYVYSNQAHTGTYYIPTAAAAGASYDLFSEENANACGIM